MWIGEDKQGGDEHIVRAMSYQCLDHGWTLDSEVLDGLEHVHQSLSHHPLQDDVQGNEYSTPPNAIAGGEESTLL